MAVTRSYRFHLRPRRGQHRWLLANLGEHRGPFRLSWCPPRGRGGYFMSTAAAIAARRQNELDAAATAPLLTRGAKGTAMISPYVKIMDRCVQQLTQLAAEFGFTPSSRDRLGQPQEPLDDTGWAAFAELKRFPVISGGRSE